MTENEAINGWTFEETIQCAENLMEEEKNIFKWDVLRHLRDFAENYKDEIQQYRAIGTIEEFKALKEKSEPMELAEHNFQDEVHHYLCPSCRSIVSCTQKYCEECGQALET